MTTTIRDINELQDRRIMMEKKLPPFGYALILLTAALILFLVVWSTKNYRTYVSQSSGSVQAANKTYIMSSYSGSITELNIAEGSYVNEGDLIAHIKSTDLDMQQDSIQSQLDIYKKQKSQYEKLVKSIQDDKNYFSETDIDDQPYYYQYETYKSQVAQKAFDASPYQAAGYSDEQIKALKQLINLGNEYGLDLTRPAQTAQEAVQWTYMGYLASVKSQDGAAMSFGRNSAFFDCYFERDLQSGKITETDAQEIIDNIVMKLRIVRFLRTKDYDAIFSGDPYWATWSDAGFGDDGRPMVTKTSFRLLNTLTLEHLGPGPEPNITIFWDPKLPEGYKRFCAKISIDTSAIQYESDKEIRNHWGDDAAIACCVSPMRVGKQMQFFAARVNSAKALLYAINGGRDEMTGMQVIDKGVIEPIAPEADGTLDYEKVKNNYEKALNWLSEVYVKALNIIHYMHDKYAYESIEMALHDKEVYRTLGCGMSGLSIAADSLSAVKYAKVYPIYNKDAKNLEGHEYEYVEGADDDLIVGYRTEGDFPIYGNDDDRADDIAKWVVSTVMGQVKRLPVYRGAVPTQSILTITSNVEYGKATGAFPSGHKKGTPYAPGANPENGMDSHGMLPSMFSVGKIDYNDALDGISLTNTITPDGLGRDEDERIGNLVGILDAGNGHGLYHANINVLRKEQLEDAVEHPEKYPHLTVRVSGYAVNFVKLTKEQQLDVISRTFHQGSVTD